MTKNIKHEVNTINKSTNCYSNFQGMLKTNIVRTAAILALMSSPFMNSNASLPSAMYDSTKSMEYIAHSGSDALGIELCQLGDVGANRVDGLIMADVQGWGTYIREGINTQVNRVLYLPRMAWNMLRSRVCRCVGTLWNSPFFDFSLLVLGYYLPFMYGISLMVDNLASRK